MGYEIKACEEQIEIALQGLKMHLGMTKVKDIAEGDLEKAI